MKSKNKVNSNKPEIIPVPCTSHVVIKSNKKLNSLVYNYLVRNYHFDVAIEFHQLVGSLDDDHENHIPCIITYPSSL